MTELKDLPEEKQQELLDVKECCRISENEFEKRFDALEYEDQKTLTISLIDDDSVMGVFDNSKNINEKILKFFRKPKYRKMVNSCLTDIEDENND